jgi:PAS domain S-box-containing protein
MEDRREKSNEQSLAEFGKLQERIDALESLVAEHEKTEAALQLSREFSEKIFSESPMGMASYDAETGQCVAANNAIAEAIGTSVEKVLEQNFFSIKSWESTGLIEAARSALKENSRKQIEVSLTTTFLKELSVDCHFSPFYAGGKKYLLCTLSDVTARKQAEDALHLAHEQLEERVLGRTQELSESNAKLQQETVERSRAEVERERLATAIEQAAEAVVITDAEGTIQYVNPAFERLSGYTRDEAIGQNPRLLKSNEHDDTFYRDLWDTITRGETWSGRIVNRGKDGLHFTEEVTISPVCDASGQTVNYVAVKRDITHETELEAQLRHAQKMESMGMLAGGIAHNLRNSLSAILGWIEIAANQNKDEEIIESSLERATETGRRAADLVKQLLKFARKSEAQHKPVRPSAVIHEGIEFLRELLPATVQFKLQIDEECRCVMADASEIQQVIIDLGTNASHAMNDDGILEVTLEEVSLTAEDAAAHLDLKEGKHVQLSVSDTGHGIDDETLERIFEPFFTTKNPGEGTGLGLSVIHGIVRDHGGAIQVVSEIGKGTTFVLFLPVCAQEAASVQAAPEVSRQTVPQESKSVLFVDDDKDFCEMAKLGLEYLGHTVESHVSAVDALDSFLATPHNFDIVITDQIMPSITGMELASRMRDVRTDMTILLLSGISEMIDDAQAEAMGVSERLVKPATPHDLDMAIRNALHGPLA